MSNLSDPSTIAERGVLTITWFAMDIMEMDDTLTLDQAYRVLEYLSKNHDANVGINWEVITDAIAVIKGE